MVGRRERLPFGPALAASGGGWSILALLWGLAFADAAAGAVVVVNTAKAELAVGSGVVGLFGSLRPALMLIGALVTLALSPQSPHPPRRPALARWAASASAAGLIAVAVSTTSVAEVLAQMVVAAAAGVSAVVILPLL